MKKNIAMRVAAFLFILTMISTCAFATTFAKYTTDGKAEDSARVAKFGVKVEMTGMDDTEYDLNISGQDAAISSSVKGKILAPGSKVNFATIALSGTPEVAVEVKYEVTVELTGWEANGEYCPLVFTIKAGGQVHEVKFVDTIENFEKALKTAIESETAKYGPETNLSEKDNLTINCQWAFEGDNVKDTILGNAAADDNAPKVSLSIICTVTQLDTYQAPNN